MIERIPIALTGYQDAAATPGSDVDTAAWRIISSPADCEAADEAIIPCTTRQPDVARKLLTECQPSDLLRVTGYLTLPGTADGGIRLDVDSVEILWEPPLQEQPPDHPTEDHSDRDRAIQALAEALTGLPCTTTAGEPPDVRINIGPIGLHGLDIGNCHSIDVTTTHTDQLTSAVTAMLATLGSLPPQAGTGLNALSPADIAGFFDDLDLTELTELTGDADASRPEHGVIGPRTWDDLLGNSPGAATDDNDR
ncbi:hypothetical protein OHB41_49780 [Streptomyces sp. NBC_01571]|uniref:hypothetical protein n=1 Tax=Streptomyces sp. NBC_01571 TaxID=2975883 RepID=UPI0022550E73|nr:hypothetical protein [Streptomyces sp. NBC_01571]MCX4581054.1 hypothetical protein [Streptomyces sp. NBC_01571]